MEAGGATRHDAEFAPVQIESVTIRDLRGLQAVSLELEPDLTLLVGRNNAGKSRILRGIGIALGAVAAELDDLTVGGATTATIDVVVSPSPPKSDTDEETFVDAVAQRLGTAVQVTREEPYRERFAWRTTIRRSAEGLGARSDTQLLTYDTGGDQWVAPDNPAGLSREQRALVTAALIETQRDLVDELGRRGSAVRRVLSDLEVPASKRDELEARLVELSGAIVSNSATLEAIRATLDELQSAVGSIGKPALNPLPLRLEELARAVAIDLDTGGGALPVRLHGAGARSLASLQVQGVLYERRLGQDGPALRPHAVTLVEEPEAHLHPQANFELAGLLQDMRGQVIASTHSSHLVTVVQPRAVRLVRQEGGSTEDLRPRASSF